MQDAVEHIREHQEINLEVVEHNISINVTLYEGCRWRIRYSLYIIYNVRG